MSAKALILCSGGLDSTTCMAIAAHEGAAMVALTFDYGQRHDVELRAAEAVAAHYGVEEHLVFRPELFRRIGGSALTADHAVPKGRDVTEMEEGVPITYVPARNLVFLSYAVAVAETRGIRDIFIGVNALDYSGYPDCRPEFIESFAKTAALATRVGAEGAGFQLRTPLLRWSKAEIIRQGLALNAPYGLTHSCYDPDSAGVACGACDSCLLRLQGFAEAGAADPIPYAKR